jgi:GNAT superfamily N-acetyltransferase
VSGLQIVPLDPDDDAAMKQWHATYEAAERAGREATAAPWTMEERRALLREAPTRKVRRAWSGVVGDDVVCVGLAVASLVDNLHRAEMEIHTRPDHRRHGFATAMLRQIEEFAREHGRRVLTTESAWRWEAGPDGVGAAGAEFLRRRGFELSLSDIQRELSLPVADDVLDRLAAEAAPHHPSYVLRSWVGPVPDDLVRSWAELASNLMTEAPVGELDLEPESADVDVQRQMEATTAAQGRTSYHTAALADAETVVAFTEIVASVRGSDRAYQWGTLVRRAERGHRLGLAVKVANLRQLQRERPDLTRLTTYNAEVNDHMVGINDRFGFVPVERMGEFQKRLDT